MIGEEKKAILERDLKQATGAELIDIPQPIRMKCPNCGCEVWGEKKILNELSTCEQCKQLVQMVQA